MRTVDIGKILLAALLCLLYERTTYLKACSSALDTSQSTFEHFLYFKFFFFFFFFFFNRGPRFNLSDINLQPCPNIGHIFIVTVIPWLVLLYV